MSFLGADGALADRREGEGASAQPVTVQGTFTQSGPATVLLHCVTDQGVSAGAERRVQVE